MENRLIKGFGENAAGHPQKICLQQVRTLIIIVSILQPLLLFPLLRISLHVGSAHLRGAGPLDAMKLENNV